MGCISINLRSLILQKIALYRKYRPENFEQLIGQEHIIRVLKNAVILGKISHAYLFSGPRGTGKTSIARILAKAINCTKRKEYNPCGKCNICVGITESRIIDLIEIDAASNRGIDEIRDLREKVKFSPTEGNYKVFIIDEVHMLTKEAFNALLKTLEEPPEHAIFILATTEINKVPMTIISRCQRHDFKRIRLDDIVTRLSEIKDAEKIGITDEALETIAESSEGGMRDAISLLDQLGSIGLSKIDEDDVENILGIAPHKMVVSFVSSLISNDKGAALSILEKTASAGTDLIIFTKSVIDFTRKILTGKLGPETEIEGTKEQLAEIKKISQEAELADILEVSDVLLWAQAAYKTNVDPKAILTLVCAKVGIESARPVEEKTGNTDSVNEGKKTEEKKGEKKAVIRPNGHWQHFLLEVKAKNNTLHACLRVAVPEFTEDNIVVLTFPYKFHKERVEEKKNRMLAEELIKKVYNQEFEIKCQIEGNGHGNKKVTDVDSAASILGGKVVD